MPRADKFCIIKIIFMAKEGTGLENLASKLGTSLCAESIQRFVFYDFLKDYGRSRM